MNPPQSALFGGAAIELSVTNDGRGVFWGCLSGYCYIELCTFDCIGPFRRPLKMILWAFIIERVTRAHLWSVLMIILFISLYNSFALGWDVIVALCVDRQDISLGVSNTRLMTEGNIRSSERWSMVQCCFLSALFELTASKELTT